MIENSNRKDVVESGLDLHFGKIRYTRLKVDWRRKLYHPHKYWGGAKYIEDWITESKVTAKILHYINISQQFFATSYDFRNRVFHTLLFLSFSRN